MTPLPMEQQILGWITQYGYLAIFCLLMFGIVGLPVPDETLLTFTGYLVFKGTFVLPLASGHGVRRQRLRHHPQLLAGPHLRAEADPPLRPLRAHHRGARQQGARLVRSAWGIGG